MNNGNGAQDKGKFWKRVGQIAPWLLVVGVAVWHFGAPPPKEIAPPTLGGNSFGDLLRSRGAQPLNPAYVVEPGTVLAFDGDVARLDHKPELLVPAGVTAPLHATGLSTNEEYHDLSHWDGKTSLDLTALLSGGGATEDVATHHTIQVDTTVGDLTLRQVTQSHLLKRLQESDVRAELDTTHGVVIVAGAFRVKDLKMVYKILQTHDRQLAIELKGSLEDSVKSGSVKEGLIQSKDIVVGIMPLWVAGGPGTAVDAEMAKHIVAQLKADGIKAQVEKGFVVAYPKIEQVGLMRRAVVLSLEGRVLKKENKAVKRENEAVKVKNSELGAEVGKQVEMIAELDTKVATERKRVVAFQGQAERAEADLLQVKGQIDAVHEQMRAAARNQNAAEMELRRTQETFKDFQKELSAVAGTRVDGIAVRVERGSGALKGMYAKAERSAHTSLGVFQRHYRQPLTLGQVLTDEEEIRQAVEDNPKALEAFSALYQQVLGLQILQDYARMGRVFSKYVR